MIGGRFMSSTRHVKIVRLGDRQTIQLPAEFELPGDEALIRKDGDSVVLEPIKKHGLLELLDSWDPIDEEFPEIDDPPPEPVKI
jgi:antitoxin VapB